MPLSASGSGDRNQRIALVGSRVPSERHTGAVSGARFSRTAQVRIVGAPSPNGAFVPMQGGGPREGRSALACRPSQQRDPGRDGLVQRHGGAAVERFGPATVRVCGLLTNPRRCRRQPALSRRPAPPSLRVRAGQLARAPLPCWWRRGGASLGKGARRAFAVARVSRADAMGGSLRPRAAAAAPSSASKPRLSS